MESSRAYDPAGRLATLTDSMGGTTVTKRDSAGNNPFVEQPNAYHAAGEPVLQLTNN
ncbi:hypothetical protein [Fodinicola feengrottensis]|uniref:RHS repeat protein n=1 Tax=Fodinicola feengrottensis TaxID=435914 RepID=A0ABN2JD37_9ACTN|nr:hypothetical protein [Fodinicola feengrottensis]